MDFTRQKYLVVIAGATASGKTSVGIQLARHFKTSILSCDSRQFYKEMTIGTAKPSSEELQAVKHYFIDNLSIHDSEYTVGNYEADTLDLLKKLYQTQDVVFMVGGSGLFIKAVCEGLDQFPEIPKSIRNELEQQLEQNGIKSLQEQLKQLDPTTYQFIDLQNPRRLIRALEVCIGSGHPYSSFKNTTITQRFFNPIYLQLEWEREILYQRINQRVDMMLKNGLLEEAQSLYPFKNLNCLRTVGYQELFDFFDQKITLEKAVELIKRNSRRYAKRQLTWFRKLDDIQSFSNDNLEAMLQYIEEKMVH